MVQLIEYLDTQLFCSPNIKFDTFDIHSAVGKIEQLNNEDVLVIFEEDMNKPYRGLIIPQSAIISQSGGKEQKSNHTEQNNKIGIYWNDITGFDGGDVPQHSTRMYTEGIFHKKLPNGYIVKNPVTLKITTQVKNYRTKEHIHYYAIPQCLITKVEFYD